MPAKIEHDNLHAMRHSLAHIMAAATTRLYKDVQLGVGPVTETGSYYDMELGDLKLSEDNFKKIEKEMKKIIREDQPIERTEMPIDEAIQWAKDSGQSYKVELLNDLKREGTTSASDIDPEALGTESEGSKVETVSFFGNGEFKDLCRGPHVASTGKVGAFKIMSVAGAYWRGKEDNPQMQRLVMVAFETQEELDQHLHNLEEAKKRDHRKLGKELDLFTFSPLVGSGLPMFTPRGSILRDKLNAYSQQLREQRGFSRVWTPHITKNDLYKTSGHWEKFGDELFLVESQETSDEFVMKPMNCPHHIQIFSSQQRSYRDMPLKFMETTTDYRDEKSGELHGLTRVRSLTQDDSHAFCTEDQIEEVANDLISAAKELYGNLGMELSVELSFRDDGDGYLGDDKLWDKAQGMIEDVAKKNGMDYVVVPGEAAFYGPKIDFRGSDSIGRTWQLSTVQFDFVQPSRFEIEYTDADGKLTTPVMVHCALLGTLERFLGVYIEHTAGRFPYWLAPEQVRLLQLNDDVADYADKVEAALQNVVSMTPLKYNELRYSRDSRSESLGKKIREAQTQKIPVILIVGPKDAEAGEVSVRMGNDEQKVAIGELANFLQEQ